MTAMPLTIRQLRSALGEASLSSCLGLETCCVVVCEGLPDAPITKVIVDDQEDGAIIEILIDESNA